MAPACPRIFPRRFGLILLLALADSSVAAPVATEKVFHVAPDGVDGADGSAAHPFATPARAQSAARALRRSHPAAPVTVRFRAGTYFLPESLTLTAQDSGSATAPTTYQAQPGATVILSGATPLAVTDLAPQQTPASVGASQVLSIRVPAPDPAQVLRSDWSRRGPLDAPLDPVGPEEVYLDGVPLEPARWPDRGWALTGEPVAGAAFAAADPRARRWSSATAWLRGYWRWDWYDEAIPLRSVDPVQRRVNLDRQPDFGLKAGARYYVFNDPAELDAPGEFFLDPVTRILRLIPPAAGNSRELLLSRLTGAVVRVIGASHVVLRGLTIEGGRADGIEIRDGLAVTVDGCTLRNLGRTGIVAGGGRGHAITGNHVYATGTGAIFASAGDRPSLTPSGFDISRNHLHGYGRRIATNRPGIEVRGVGMVVTHNEIHDAPHTAILLQGNDHRIEANDIYRVCTDTSDAGAIYIGRDWTARGHLIRRNFIHQLSGLDGRGDVTAIYLDDFASGITVESNVIAKVFRGVLIGGGRDNVVANNLFAGNGTTISLDARGTGWAHEALSPASELMTHLRSVPYRSALWTRRYPELRALLEDQPALPKRNRIDNNVILDPGPILIDPTAAPLGSSTNNLQTDANPGFADPAGNDFTVTDTGRLSQAIPGWHPIEFRSIGRH